jgi:hypothetical protein
VKKALLTAQATLRFFRTETHFEIELDVRGRLPLRREIGHWQRAGIPLAPKSFPDGRAADHDFAFVETGATCHRIESRHEIHATMIRTSKWKSGRESITEFPTYGLKVHTPLDLLVTLISSDLGNASSSTANLFQAHVVSGTKLHAFEARPVARDGHEILLEARWCALSSLDALGADAIWPCEKLGKAEPLKLAIDTNNISLSRASYIAPVLGALTLELSGVELD